MRTGRATGTWLAALLLLVAPSGCGRRHVRSRAEAPGPPRFEDLTLTAGIDRPAWCGSPGKEHLLESVGSGAAFVDLDGDGHDDILLLDAWRLGDPPAAGGPRTVLSRGRFSYYHNRGDGTFEDRTERAGLGGNGAWGLGAAAGDIDGDGDLDLYVYCFGPNLLYRNRGDGTFEEVGAAAGVADPGWGGGAAFFDADLDGDLDLYLANYVEATMDEVLAATRTLTYKGQLKVMVGPFGLAGGFDRFYRNRGDGTFEEAGAEVGLVDRAQSYGLGVLAADLDADGDQDLWVANDSNPNYLFQNEGGQFREIGVTSGAAFDAGGAAQASMGVAVLDYDRDGILDLFTTNFAQDASTLYHGEPMMFYSDVAAATGIAAITYEPLSWGTLPIDFDQDARPDLVVANGHIYPQVDALGDGSRFRQRPLLLLNRGDTFIDGSAAAGPGFAVEGSSRGLASGDLEGDGDLDLLLTRIDQPPLLLAYRGGDASRRIVVEPAGRSWPRWIGARVELESGGTRQTQVILSGGSYATQSALRAVFSLAHGATTGKVRVSFAGGASQEFRDVAGGTVVRVDVPGPGRTRR